MELTRTQSLPMKVFVAGVVVLGLGDGAVVVVEGDGGDKMRHNRLAD